MSYAWPGEPGGIDFYSRLCTRIISLIVKHTWRELLISHRFRAVSSPQVSEFRISRGDITHHCHYADQRSLRIFYRGNRKLD